MRLKNITIAGFRGFATRQQFDLSADAIVVVGVNGLGKTSLFDAILWCLSGKLPRIGADDRIVSLYSPTGEANVSLSLIDENGAILTVRRNTDGKSQSLQLKEGERELKGSTAIARLNEKLWPETSSVSDGEAVVNAALVQSVYLQQDRVRDFLDATTDQDRFNIISQLVGTGALTDFQLQLEKQRTSWTRATTQLQKDGGGIEERVESLQRQLEKLRKSSSAQTDEGTPSWADWWNTVMRHGLSARDIPSIESSEASATLDNALRELGALRDKCSRRRSVAEELQQLLGREPPISTESIEILRANAVTATNGLQAVKKQLEVARSKAAQMRQLKVEALELQEQNRALAQIALKLLADKCPVCGQDYDVEQTRMRLTNLIAERGGPPSTETQDEDVVKLSIQERDAILAEEKSRNTLREAEAALVKYREWTEARDRRLVELGVKSENAEQIKNDLATIVKESIQLDADLVLQRRFGENLALHLGREVAKSRITTVANELQSAEKERTVHRAVIETREATGKHVNILLDELREAASKVAVDKLNEIEPFLQRVYARIDPHPAFRVVKFATHLIRGRGRLDTEIHDRDEQLSSDSPSSVLSSSQMNALAVSIFLAFNLALPRLPIDAALLDDPIQSLDDINLLGLIDLLRRTKDRRQLIVSTHDERFGRLLARKLRPTDQKLRTSVIELSGWTRNGPEVKQHDVSAESVRLRLVRAG